MKKVILAAVAVAAFFSAKAQDTWTVDKAHTSVNFSVTHLLITEVDGQFKNFEGQMISKSPDFVGAEISFTVDVNSISTDNEMRDNHLKSDAFFDAAKFPKMTFKSVSFTKVNGNKYALTGDLTIRDVTKRVTFDVTYGGTVNDGHGNTKAGFKATTVINRFDYGLKWNALTEAGGAVVGQDVTITINVELAKDKAK